MSNNPNPGSDAAIAKGCTCPVLDNAHGKGAYGVEGKFWISVGCPLHGKPALAEMEDKADG